MLNKKTSTVFFIHPKEKCSLFCAYCAVSKDESLLISGGSDSSLILWRDVTEKRQEEAEEARQKLILQEQELANLVKSDQLLSALKLALSLDRPLQVLRIIQGECCCRMWYSLEAITLIIDYSYLRVFHNIKKDGYSMSVADVVR
jgi:hypothetical protein